MPAGIAAFRGRTAFDARFFDEGVRVQGTRRRAGFELRWRPGPFGVQAEYARASTERRGAGEGGADLAPFVVSGWYLAGTWVLTGEAKAEGLEEPARPLLRGGWGAVELAARVEGLRFERAESVAGNAVRALTLGVNWYLNRWMKAQANVVRERLADPSQGPLPGCRSFWSQVVRLQLAL